MSPVSMVLTVFFVLLVVFLVLFLKNRSKFGEDNCMIAFVIVVFMIGCCFMFCAGVHKLAHEQFCQKYQIDDKHTDFYRNNAESPVLVHVATYGTFSGEREQTVIVPPGQVRYFGHGKVLWVDSE